jgi:hypothetical protein
MSSTPDLFTDPVCDRLVTYLRDGLNEAYPEQIVVNSTRSYDAYNVPYTEYPLLKVYRVSEMGKIDRNESEVQLVISYSLVFPELEQLAPIMIWVRRQIRRLLAGWDVNCPGFPILSNQYRADYRTMFNEQTLKVHKFLQFSLTVSDTTAVYP